MTLSPLTGGAVRHYLSRGKMHPDTSIVGTSSPVASPEGPEGPSAEWPEQVLRLAVEHIYRDRSENLKDLRAEFLEEIQKEADFGPEVPQKKAVGELESLLLSARSLVDPIPDPVELSKDVLNQKSQFDRREAAYLAVKHGLGLT